MNLKLEAIPVEKARFVVSLGGLIVAGIFLWRTAVAFADFRNEINANFQRLESTLTERTNDRWTGTDQQLWAYELEKQNRDVLRAENAKNGLVVPEARHKRTVPKQGDGDQ